MTPLRVLDVGQLIAGPVAATILADLGADVICIEDPGTGDLLRYSGRQITEDVSSYWLIEGRNKRSVTLDMRAERGREVFLRLVATADVLIENLALGRMDAWGLGPAQLEEVNPRLVYVRVSGYGTTGPLADRRAVDRTALAFSGFANVCGEAGGPPVMPGFMIADYSTALLAALGAVEAVRRRDALGPEGRGEVVDVSLYDALLRSAGSMLVDHSLDGTVAERRSGRSGNSAPSGFYEARDGRWVAIVVVSDAMFRRFVAATGWRWAMAGDDVDVRLRRHGRAEVEAATAAWVGDRDADDVVERMEEAGVCVAALNTNADLAVNDHLRARGDVVTVEGPDGRPLQMQGAVPKIGDGDEPAIRWTGQPLGAANREVYGGLLEMDDDELDALRADGVI